MACGIENYRQFVPTTIMKVLPLIPEVEYQDLFLTRNLATTGSEATDKRLAETMTIENLNLLEFQLIEALAAGATSIKIPYPLAGGLTGPVYEFMIEDEIISVNGTTKVDEAVPVPTYATFTIVRAIRGTTDAAHAINKLAIFDTKGDTVCGCNTCICVPSPYSKVDNGVEYIFDCNEYCLEDETLRGDEMGTLSLRQKTAKDTFVKMVAKVANKILYGIGEINANEKLNKVDGLKNLMIKYGAIIDNAVAAITYDRLNAMALQLRNERQSGANTLVLNLSTRASLQPELKANGCCPSNAVNPADQTAGYRFGSIILAGVVYKVIALNTVRVGDVFFMVTNANNQNPYFTKHFRRSVAKNALFNNLETWTQEINCPNERYKVETYFTLMLQYASKHGMITNGTN